MFKEILPDLFLWQDCCNVYVLRRGREAALVEFGDGSVLGRLGELGVERVTDIFCTHHHRDCVQGLSCAPQEARVWVPHNEGDLFARVEAHWQARPLWNDYNTRQDRFSSLQDLRVSGTLKDYERILWNGIELQVMPTPGHTTGSISLLGEIGGRRVGFTGDLIAAPGCLWSLAATQWGYSGAEGAAAALASLLDLQDWRPERLLPAHGEVMDRPEEAITRLAAGLEELLRLRGKNTRLRSLRERPYEALTPHLLRGRACLANTYVLLSGSGNALFIDFGYDFNTDPPAGSDRASRRPWLYTLPALKRQFGVNKIDVVIPTHVHDDHVAGIELLQRVEGTRCWAAEHLAPVLEQPARYDLPALWYEPVRVDRRLPLETPVNWEEYRLTLYPLPGHTRYAAALAFEVDGERVLAVGDHYQGEAGLGWNYIYAGGFHPQDYSRSAQVYRRAAPSLILPGHWPPFRPDAGYLEQVEAQAEQLAALHRRLLPPGGGGDGWQARISPYQAELTAGAWSRFEVEVENPLAQAAAVCLRPVLPRGWQGREAEIEILLPPGGTGVGVFHARPPAGLRARRERLAVDLSVQGRRLGQRAEALANVVPAQEEGLDG